MAHAWTLAALLTAAVAVGGSADAAEENQWEKFKDAAKSAGEAVVQGTKNTAEKVADGAERAGEVVAGKYEDAKAYVHEKTAE